MSNYNQNDFWQNSSGENPEDGSDYMKTSSRNNMGTAAMILSLIAMITIQVFFISIPCAAVAIILALLSKGKGRLMPKARAALITGVTAAVLSASITGYAVYYVMHDPAMRAQIENMYDYYLDPDASSNAGSPDVQDPEELIREIISGEYRNKQNQDSSSAGAEGSGYGDSLSDSSQPQAAAGNGGSYV